MELMPALKFGLLNGWIFLVIEFIIQGGLLLVFPKDVVTRLFNRSGWNTKQKAFTILGKLFSLACLILIVLTPLKINSSPFIFGLILYGIGLVGLAIAMLNFKDSPSDQPVVKGLYKVSRHPQIVALFLIFLGITLTINSWMALFMLVISKIFQHFGILAEEEICIKQYGDAYHAYMEKVPRYFMFF